MTTRSSKVSRNESRARARLARQFLEVAGLADAFSEELNDSGTSNAVASLAVLSGIAASDAICGVALGIRASGDSHADAVALLKSVRPGGASYAKDLQRLLNAKSTVQYGADLTSGKLAADCLKWADRLLAGAEAELRGPVE